VIAPERRTSTRGAPTSDAIHTVARFRILLYSADGQSLPGVDGHNIYVWDLPTQDTRMRFRDTSLDSNSIDNLVASPDGEQLVTQSGGASASGR